MINVNVALMATCLGILATLFGLVRYVVDVIAKFEGRVRKLETADQVRKEQVNSMFNMIRYRLKNLEQYNKKDGFEPHRLPGDSTGAPWAED